MNHPFPSLRSVPEWDVSAIIWASDEESLCEEPDRIRFISRICARFIETEEDCEEIEYLLSLMRDRRPSETSKAFSQVDTNASIQTHGSGLAPPHGVPPDSGNATPGALLGKRPALGDESGEAALAGYASALKRLKVRTGDPGLEERFSAPLFLIPSGGRFE